MTHTVTAKLNKAARKFDNQAGSTFFVSLGEKNYDFKEKTNKWTNYDAALFAKDKQIDFYTSVLVEGAILTVSGSGIIIDDSNKEYPAKLILQDAKLDFVSAQFGTDGLSSPTMPSQPQAQQAPSDDSSFDQIPF
jgi:single-strand DNA-binding protein